MVCGTVGAEVVVGIVVVVRLNVVVSMGLMVETIGGKLVVVLSGLLFRQSHLYEEITLSHSCYKKYIMAITSSALYELHKKLCRIKLNSKVRTGGKLSKGP